MKKKPDLDQLCINTIRFLAADAVQKANSGHPGMPMGAASMAYVLWTKFLKHNPQNPTWMNRDRFILSAGHGSMLLYSLLYLTGYDISIDDLKNFRQWGSKTPGHPEYGHTPGVEVTTGPLGQGFATGVGMAIAQKYLAARFNKPGYPVVDHFIYAIAGDGDLMEGISHEAASLAGHLKLGNLIYLYDDNHISIEGSTELAFTEDRLKRFEAYGWHVQYVEDGNDLVAIEKAIQLAQEVQDQPSLIAVRTHIGYGSPHKQDTASAHGEPLGEEELKLTKENLGWPPDQTFYVPEEALSHFRLALENGKKAEDEWKQLFNSYKKEYPELAKEYEQWISGKLANGWEKGIPAFQADEKGMATRAASGKVINALATTIPNLFGGSADLAPSNKTAINNEGSFSPENYGGRNIHFGVREHAMGAILNGMALYGGVIPYGGTFLVFADYMRPAIRLAALMGIRVIYVFTHDSIGLGEDGPTHQPIEHLASIRAIPNMLLIRPADANETAVAWKVAIHEKKRPVALALSRQNVPTLDRQKYAGAEGLEKGAYILYQTSDTPELIFIATGSEVHIALEAAQQLEKVGVGVRVVSMPCMELFEEQDEVYKEKVLPSSVKKRIIIEAGVPFGWHKYAGDEGVILGIDHFGASAPYKVIYEKFGLTAEVVVEKAKNLLKS
jgi:transketolase